MRFIGVIPARYASTRFPGKPLAVLGGKTVIQRVYERVASVIDETCVATDDERIFSAVKAFGGKAVMTSPNHKSGTDRIQEAVTKLLPAGEQPPADLVVVNVQGDEPFIQQSQIETVCRCFDDPQTQIATLAKHFINEELRIKGEECSASENFQLSTFNFQLINNPNSPKVVTDLKGYALYFSRSVIPFVRGQETETWPAAFPFMKHIGLYAYRADVLREITNLPQSPLEIAESLEQLRWLQNGYKIKVGITDIETVGIDTPDDLRRAELFLKEKEMK